MSAPDNRPYLNTDRRTRRVVDLTEPDALAQGVRLRTDAVLDDPIAMARATEAVQVSADMTNSARAHYIVAVALGERPL